MYNVCSCLIELSHAFSLLSVHQSKLGKTKITLVDFVRDRFNIGNQKIVQQPEELRKRRPAPPFRKSGITGNTSDDPILQHSSSGETGKLEQMIADELSSLRGQLHELPGSLRWESVTQLRPTHCDQTVAHQALLSMGFSRQEFWSGLPFPSPGDLPNLQKTMGRMCVS